MFSVKYIYISNHYKNIKGQKNEKLSTKISIAHIKLIHLRTQNIMYGSLNKH